MSVTNRFSPVDVDRNLRLLFLYQTLSGALVWLPVFVLFTRARFDLDGALLLAAVYYLAVVVLEVPSGWLSDRFGRALTLRIAALSWVVANICFLFGHSSIVAVAVGQIFLAGGFASLSGTDVSFHYDTLEAAGLEDQYRRRQARFASFRFAATAVGSIVGGLVGLINLRIAFAIALVLALAQLVIALGFQEPPGERVADALPTQLRLCIGYLRDRYLLWMTFYAVLSVTLVHLAFTLMQPWLTEVLGRSPDDVGATPLFAGLVFASTAVVGSGAARASAPAASRAGTVPTLIGLAALSATIVTGMALWVHAAVLLLVAFRSAQGAAGAILISSVVAPRVAQNHRATMLSLNSLVGRLGYGAILMASSRWASDDVSAVLGWFSAISWLLVIALAVAAWIMLPRPLQLRST